MREIIVDRENGAKAFVLFELTKGNIAEIKDRCGLSFHSDGRPLFVRRARAPMIRSPRSLIYN